MRLIVDRKSDSFERISQIQNKMQFKCKRVDKYFPDGWKLKYLIKSGNTKSSGIVVFLYMACDTTAS